MKVKISETIDLVIVNFYPFKNIKKTNNKHENRLKTLILVGQHLVRAAAKNHENTYSIIYSMWVIMKSFTKKLQNIKVHIT